MSQITSAHYGKSRIPVLKIVREQGRDCLFQALISIDTEGDDILSAYTAGDNRAILPTDTMKNLVYALALQYEISSSEDLARHLGREFLRRYPTITRLTVTVDEIAWARLEVPDPERGGRRAGPISFRQRGGEEDWARVVADRASLSIESGTRQLTLLKTTDSAFSGFLVDDFTTLAETEDRVLATSLRGSWRARDADLDYRALNAEVKATIVEVFAGFRSRSVQELAHAMATTVLGRCENVLEISLALPNLHCFLLDLSRFGLENRDTLYLPTDAPHGDLHVTIRR